MVRLVHYPNDCDHKWGEADAAEDHGGHAGRVGEGEGRADDADEAEGEE